MVVCCSVSRKKPERVPSEFLLDQSEFQSPAECLSRSGGTASFFRVAKKEMNIAEYVGKDVARSLQEINFYWKVHQMRSSADTSESWKRLLVFFVDCPGILENFPCASDEVVETRSLLVLSRFGFGYRSPRVLDIKMGPRTAVAGWMGKSHYAAWRANRLSSLTNSGLEGFRLEGMDGLPESLASMMIGKKKRRRLQLQRLKAFDFFSFFLENQRVDAGDWQLAVLASSIDQLHALYGALEEISDPQMWIGSSVGIVTDLESEIPQVQVKIFDWGRSAIGAYPHKAANWREYKNSVRRLLVEAGVLLRTRVGNLKEFPIVIRIWDFDVLSADDFIGSVSLDLSGLEVSEVGKFLVMGNFPLSERPNASVDLEIRDGVSSWGERSVRIKISGANNLPRMDVPPGSADPMVEILVGKFRASQKSKIIFDSLNPVWGAEFSLVIDVHGNLFSQFIQSSILSSDGESIEALRATIDRKI